MLSILKYIYKIDELLYFHQFIIILQNSDVYQNQNMHSRIADILKPICVLTTELCQIFKRNISILSMG